MSRFVKPALWTFGALAAGGLAFWLLLALDIPYRSTATPVTTPVPSTAPPPEQRAWVLDVRAGPDDRSAVLHVNLPPCAEAPHARVTEAGDRVEAEVLFRPRKGVRCTPGPADFPITTAAPIGNRPVIVNGGDAWPVAAGPKQCYPGLGCDPPADHCDPAWIAQRNGGADAEYSGTTRSCDQDWLIQDRQRHGGQAATRVVYRWASYGWASFAEAKGGGCAELLAADPKFPTALCQNLAPPS
ncbi:MULTISPECIES: hypothetical protein [Amycolatopsis]|uniref:Uncharacterized protein n=1 Tax=Amycolatopsis bullii TaxID=941987 RepID=A0ABQ3JWB3_9PSEU|nr:hypothetical protein [Amycolatopsis bullii]GHF91878.1 hypothetical protein GCM10017567_02630 [Amycolatopsis bullii]